MNIKEFDPNNIEIDKILKKTFSFTILDMWRSKRPKNLYCKSFIAYFRYINRYFKEINEYKYLAIAPTNKSKERIKKNMKNYGIKSEI